MAWKKLSIETSSQARDAMKDAEIADYAAEIMKDKGVYLVVNLSGLKPYEANILKQEMLSLGGDVAVPPGVADCTRKNCTVIVFGNLKQYKQLLTVMEKQAALIKCDLLVKDLREITQQSD